MAPQNYFAMEREEKDEKNCHVYEARSTFQLLCKQLLHYKLLSPFSWLSLFSDERFLENNKKKRQKENNGKVFHKYFFCQFYLNGRHIWERKKAKLVKS